MRKLSITIAIGSCALAALGLAPNAADQPPPPPPPSQVVEECTIGVANGDPTPDGRPLIWKSRDTANKDNEVYWNTALPIPFLAVVDADGNPDSRAWMGVNQRGFAILNANSTDLDTAKVARSNGDFMRSALGFCRSVDDFLAHLDTTAGKRYTHGNFAVLDSAGAALMIEASSDTHWTYDTRDTPSGYIIRTNFACNDTAGEDISSCTGIERFRRSHVLIEQLYTESNLTPEGLFAVHMRDFATREGQPLTVPCDGCGEPDSLYGYIDAGWSICRDISVSSAVIQGIAPLPTRGEPAYLSTMWVQLGHPAVAIATPFWPVGPAPPVADGDGRAPLCDRARFIQRWLFHHHFYPRLLDSFRLRDGEGGGLWSETLPAEEAILAYTRDRLMGWREEPPAWPVLLAVEDSLASAALDELWSLTAVEEPDVPGPASASLLGQVHPNPFNSGAVVPYSVPRAGQVELAVYDARGRRVAVLFEGWREAGEYSVAWDATGLSSGPYLVRLRVDGREYTGKCVYLK